MQHDNSIWNLKRYVEKEYLNTTTSYATFTYPSVKKWLSNDDIYLKWSNLFWAPKQTFDAQITYTLKFQYG